MSACVLCGFPVSELLEVAHLDQVRTNDAPDNLARLCPTCHRMHDTGLIPTVEVKEAREMAARGRMADVGDLHRRIAAAIASGVVRVDWSLLHKGAQQRAGETIRARSKKLKASKAGKKAWVTRRLCAEQ